MYFALEEEQQQEAKRCAIWAIDLTWLETKGQGLLPKKKGTLLTADSTTRPNTLTIYSATAKKL